MEIFNLNLYYIFFLQFLITARCETKYSSFGNKVYTFSNHKANFTEANSNCMRLHGNLALIKSQETQDFINLQLEDYKSADGLTFSSMYWIGLHQDDDNTTWKWLDGSTLDYDNWFYLEPNHILKEKCVSIGTKLKNTQRRYNTFGFWFNINCARKFKYICEYPFGNGFISTNYLKISNFNQSVSCTIFGGSNYSAIWIRRDSVVTKDSSKTIYQTYESQESHQTARIHFVGSNVTDVFACVLKYENQNLKTLQLTVENMFHGKLVRLVEKEVDTLKSDNISCSMRGYPLPEIVWMRSFKVLEKDDDVFKITNIYDRNTWTTTSTISIKNPISFEKNSTLHCTAVESKLNVEKKIFYLNSDAEMINQQDFKVMMTSNNTRLCKRFNGIPKAASNSSNHYCLFTAASLRKPQIKGDICNERETLLILSDFTLSKPQFTFNSSDNGNISIEAVQSRNIIVKVKGILPQTDFNIELSYKPRYWNNLIDLRYAFRARKKQTEIKKFYQSNDGECMYDSSKNSSVYEPECVEANIKSFSDSNVTMESKIVYINTSIVGINKEFKSKSNSEYKNKFTVKLCKCVTGEESEEYTCDKEKQKLRYSLLPLSAYLAPILVASLLIIGVLILLYFSISKG